MFNQAVLVIATLVAIVSTTPVAPAINTAGLPNTHCSIAVQPSLGRLKALACMLESNVMDQMKDPTIPSFDFFNPPINADIDTFIQTVSSCNCSNILLKSTKEYTATSVYGVNTHIVVRGLYDPRINQDPLPYIHQQYLPEDITTDGASTPVNTEWILRDHLNSLKGYIQYYTPAKSITGGDKLASIADILDKTLSTYLNYTFTDECPADERVPAFTGFTTDYCEFKCANWHFNETIKGLYFALANQAIYPPASGPLTNASPYPEKLQWQTTNCCDAQPLEQLTLQEYRNLTCSLEMLNLEAFKFFETLKDQSKAVINCPSGLATITGINTWEQYLQAGLYPPFNWPMYSNLYIYANHIAALTKQHDDLQRLLSDATGNYLCYNNGPAHDGFNKIIEIIESILPQAQKWLLAHNCPYCSTCVDSTIPSPNPAPIETFLPCDENGSFQQVSCLLIDIQKISESVWLYLNMRNEATPTWGSTCFELLL